MRIRGGGIDSFLGFEYCVVITLASREFRVLLTILPYFLRFFQRACGVWAFLASSGSHGVATPPLLPTLTVYSHEVPLLGFRLMWCSSGLLLRLATVVATITVPILLLALRSVAVVAFFPQFRDFRASLGSSVLLRNFSIYS